MSAGNQQERLSAISFEEASLLAGFAMGEGSFMIVCRPRGTTWRISAAFNVSQNDPTPLEFMRQAIGCGTMRRAGAGGWYFEVNRLTDIRDIIIPFFDRFPLMGSKQQDFALFKEAVLILCKKNALEANDWARVVLLRHQMNGGGKRRYTTERILRDYTPNDGILVVDDIVRSHGRS